MNSGGFANIGQKRLTKNGATDFHPAWSPNGKKIAFVSTRDLNSEMYAMNPDGTGQTNLTQFPAVNDGQPDWQPTCTIIGTGGNDALVGTAGDDFICGLDDDDTISGGSGNEVIIGGRGRDRFFEEAGNDLLNSKDGVKHNDT